MKEARPSLVVMPAWLIVGCRSQAASPTSAGVPTETAAPTARPTDTPTRTVAPTATFTPGPTPDIVAPVVAAGPPRALGPKWEFDLSTGQPAAMP